MSRWYNEEYFVRRFVANWERCADEIVTVDGGSTDNSYHLFKLFNPFGRFVDFKDRVSGVTGGSRNPEGAHLNRCIDAVSDADWIVLTEADAWPNLNLQTVFRFIIEELDKSSYDALFTWLYYLGPSEHWDRYHYPELLAGVGMTAWRRSLNLRADENSLFEPALHIPKEVRCLNLYGDNWRCPMYRVHLTYDTQELIEKKNKFYKEVHGLEFPHPDKRFSRTESVPSSCRWFYDSRDNLAFSPDSMLDAENEHYEKLWKIAQKESFKEFNRLKNQGVFK